VQLVNLHATEPREVLVQAGAFGEHRFATVRHQGQSADVHRKCFRVHLCPGAWGRLDLGMDRYVQRPTYAAPWQEGPPSGR
jgi:hypothetical protein